MAVDWTGYRPFDPGVYEPLKRVPREQAQAHFERLMAARSERRQALAALVLRAGVALGPTDVDLAALCAWFIDEVEHLPSEPDSPTPIWQAVIVDIALHLGEILIERQPHLRWQLYTHLAKAHGYQRPTIVGFRGVTDPFYYVDPGHLVAAFAALVARKRPVKRDYFAYLVRRAAQAA